MEATEYQVWQRVAGKPQPTLETLLRLAREQAAALGAMAAASAGQRKTVLQHLSCQAVFAARTVAGAAILDGETLPPSAPHPEAGTRRALALAYRRSRELWEAYRARAGGGAYGQAFSHLASQEAQSGAQLLALLGSGAG